MSRYAALTAAALVAVTAGCVLFNRGAGFDTRPLTVETVDLFDQRALSRLAKPSWRGDWLFRRDRLDLIDLELKNVKPDILLLQGVLEKRGNGAESDRAILGAGALADYDWRQQHVEDFADTQEDASMAVVVSLPSKIENDHATPKDTWVMGKGGFLMAATVASEGQALTVFNVRMPPPTDPGASLWYDFVRDRILERLKRDHRCAKRLIVGGYLPGDESNRHFGDFVRALQLKDASSGFCQIASKCYTATPANDTFMATVGDESPTRTDKLFVNQTAFVYVSGRNFEESDPGNRYAREFGLSRLWPTQRFGWGAQIRLARCNLDELETPFATP